MKIRSPLLTKIAAWIAVRCMKLLFFTCRKEFHMLGGLKNVIPYWDTGENRYLYSIWHDQILMVVFSGKPHKVAGLVSRHQDGSYLASAMKMVGLRPIRGSSSRGGAQAMKEMLEAAGDHHITITPDGPRGPREQLKPGIVFLASHTERNIIPAAFGASRYWTIKGNWTDMVIPKPFSKVIAVGGPIVIVPQGLTKDQLQDHVSELQSRMDDLQTIIRRRLDGETWDALDTVPTGDQSSPAKQQPVSEATAA